MLLILNFVSQIFIIFLFKASVIQRLCSRLPTEQFYKKHLLETILFTHTHTVHTLPHAAVSTKCATSLNSEFTLH